MGSQGEIFECEKILGDSGNLEDSVGLAERPQPDQERESQNFSVGIAFHFRITPNPAPASAYFLRCP